MADEKTQDAAPEEDFEAAFNEFAGGGDANPEPEEPAVEEEPVADEEEPVVDQEEPESEPQAAATPTDETQAPNVEQRIAELERERDMWRQRFASDNGRVSAFQRKINDLEKALAEQQKQREERPSGKADELPDKLKTFAEDYPDIAEALQLQLERERAAIREEVMKNLTPIQQAERQRQEQARRQFFSMQEQQVEAKHAGWKDTVRSPDFGSWLRSQPPGVQQLSSSDNAADAIFLLDQFKAARTARQQQAQTQQADEIQAQRERRLQDSEAPTTRRVARRDPAPDGDFESLFNYYARNRG